MFRTPFIYHKTILTQGVGESFLAAQIEKWEHALPPEVRLAYLPQPGIVRLRLTGRGPDEPRIRSLVDEQVGLLYKLIPDYIFGQDHDTLEEIAGRLLRSKGSTLATAESCTGGYIAHLITSVPGSSGYFKGSVVAYANEAKTRILGIPEEILNAHGAVSEEVVTLMASHARDLLKVDFALATSGIAGPDGGTDEKPVGTIWIAVATPVKVIAKKFLFGDSRERNIRRSALQGLRMLVEEVGGSE
jgi:nicotinamide-nucleotide amidase